jgi:hypothetical protein
MVPLGLVLLGLDGVDIINSCGGKGRGRMLLINKLMSGSVGNMESLERGEAISA